MVLWRYELHFPDGRRETRVLAAGNRRAALERAQAHAARHGAQVGGDLEVVTPG